ncbi:hypothetical protein [Rodentibacter ratti]|nr:hypothetical protein [Rodentibacter ratti]
MDTIILIIIYLVAVFSIIFVNHVIDKANSRYFYRQLERLFIQQKLTSYNFALLIKETKVKQFYIPSNLRTLYFKMLLDENIDEARLQYLLNLLDEYENKLNSNLNLLPSTLKEKFQLLRSKDNEAIIAQIVEVIIDIYFSDKKYKKLSFILGILSFFLTIIGTLPIIFNYFST